ncbi:unnamed protein product [Polarella glacialis]|uniref:Uncharacterized protein n=1 Tax=Polarella glacialis TaxID=89957 RepID=A0A813JSA9_POLGL|nr:unnamed protein product [Polarella glacialis]
MARANARTLEHDGLISEAKQQETAKQGSLEEAGRLVAALGGEVKEVENVELEALDRVKAVAKKRREAAKVTAQRRAELQDVLVLLEMEAARHAKVREGAASFESQQDAKRQKMDELQQVLDEAEKAKDEMKQRERDAREAMRKLVNEQKQLSRLGPFGLRQRASQKVTQALGEPPARVMDVLVIEVYLCKRDFATRGMSEYLIGTIKIADVARSPTTVPLGSFERDAVEQDPEIAQSTAELASAGLGARILIVLIKIHVSSQGRPQASSPLYKQMGWSPSLQANGGFLNALLRKGARSSLDSILAATLAERWSSCGSGFDLDHLSPYQLLTLSAPKVLGWSMPTDVISFDIHVSGSGNPQVSAPCWLNVSPPQGEKGGASGSKGAPQGEEWVQAKGSSKGYDSKGSSKGSSSGWPCDQDMTLSMRVILTMSLLPHSGASRACKCEILLRGYNRRLENVKGGGLVPDYPSGFSATLCCRANRPVYLRLTVFEIELAHCLMDHLRSQNAEAACKEPPAWSSKGSSAPPPSPFGHKGKDGPGKGNGWTWSPGKGKSEEVSSKRAGLGASYRRPLQALMLVLALLRRFVGTSGWQWAAACQLDCCYAPCCCFTVMLVVYQRRSLPARCLDAEKLSTLGSASAEDPINMGEYQGLVAGILPDGSAHIECLDIKEAFGGRSAVVPEFVIADCGLVEGNLVCFSVQVTGEGIPEVIAPCWICCSSEKWVQQHLPRILGMQQEPAEPAGPPLSNKRPLPLPLPVPAVMAAPVEAEELPDAEEAAEDADGYAEYAEPVEEEEAPADEEAPPEVEEEPQEPPAKRFKPLPQGPLSRGRLGSPGAGAAKGFPPRGAFDGKGSSKGKSLPQASGPPRAFAAVRPQTYGAPPQVKGKGKKGW